MKHNVKRHAVVQPLDQSYRYIPLTKGLNAIVDAEDLDRLSFCSWNADFEGRYKRTLYARNRSGVRMHRFLAGCEGDFQVDHINGDTLDNRKANLRICSQSQNQCNRGATRKNKSGLKGVCTVPGGRYRAMIEFNKQRHDLGYYSTPEEAHEAYKKAALRLHGEFARFSSEEKPMSDHEKKHPCPEPPDPPIQPADSEPGAPPDPPPGSGN